MQTDGDIQVAILSSRPTLDLAINTWVPGYLARTSTDLDVIVDLTQHGGVIVIDLLHGDGPELIRTLRERGVDRPIVVLASARQTYEPPVNGDVVVANSTAIEELTAAFEAAQARHRSHRLLSAREGEAQPSNPPTVSAAVPKGSSRTSAELGETHKAAGLSDDLASRDGADAETEEDVSESLETTTRRASVNASPAERPMTSGANGNREGERKTPPVMFVGHEPPGSRRQDRRGDGRARRGLRIGRRSRRARELLEDSVADVWNRPERTEEPLDPDADRESSAADDEPHEAEPLEIIDLTEPLFRSGANAKRPKAFDRDSSIPVHPTGEVPAAGAATAGDEQPANVIEPIPTSPPPSSPPVGSVTSPDVGATSAVELSAVTGDPQHACLVDAWRAARAWIILDELEPLIGSGSAVVAVPTSESSFGIVAGIGIAPFEARRSIRMDHPVVTELKRPGGWFIRPADAPGSFGPLLPLAECAHLLALAVPGTGGKPDAIVVIGRHEPFDIDEAAGTAAIVQDHRHLDAHLRRLQAPGTELTRSTEPKLAGKPVVLAGWQVLDDLFPLLSGAAAAVAFRDGDLYAVSAAVRLDPAKAGRVIDRRHALLQALRSNTAGVIVRAAGDDRALVSGLPLPRAAFVAALPLGDVGRPHGLALLSHHRRIEPAELEGWRATLAEHPVQSLGE